jgi:hypothetical protein
MQVKANLLPSVKAWLDRLSCAPGLHLHHDFSSDTGSHDTLQPLIGKVAVQCCLQDVLGPGKFFQGLATLCSSLVACQADSDTA